MKATTEMILKELSARYSALGTVENDVRAAYEALHACFAKGGRVYLCGNGGSAADCEHMAGELLKCFKIKRPMPDAFKATLSAYGEDGEVLAENLEGGLPVVSLTGHVAFSTAFQNDNTPALVFAQQVNAYGRPGDVLVVFSTSGNSKNVVAALKTAKALGIKTVAMTGETGGELADIADIVIKAPACETYKVQEYHLPIYHAICAEAERIIFEEN